MAAQIHGVEGWVARRAQALGVGVDGIGPSVRSALARHQRALGDARRVRSAMERMGIAWLVVKGPALVACHDSPDLRSYVDLDVFVDPSNVREVTGALLEAGFTVVDRNWPFLQAQSVHEFRLLGPGGGIIDLHWSLGVGPVHKDRSPSFTTLIERSRMVLVQGLQVPTLGWADTIVHLAVHAAGSGGHRLIWAADLRAVMRSAPATPELVRVANEWGAAPALDLMLRRAHRSLGVRYPFNLRGALVRPGPWTWLVEVSDRLTPMARHQEGGSIGRLVARSCRASSGASLLEVGRRATSWWFGGRRPSPTAEQLADVSAYGSSLQPAGGAGAEEAFFAWVTTSRGPA